MKKYWMALLIGVAAAHFAAAQIATPADDVLGAHLNYGRGCAACHAMHSGASGNGARRATDPTAGVTALWGEDATGLYGKTIATGGGNFVEVLPASLSAGTPDTTGMLTCLTCHDGNYAQNAMMRNKIYETLPATYGSGSLIPTLIGNSGGNEGSYLSQHPVGLSAKIGCGGASNWDCTETGGVIVMNGAKSKKFAANYGFFVKPGDYANSPVVVCTTCHEPHRMNVVSVSSSSNSGLPSGDYTTMFFLRGPYNPNDSNPLSNQTAQFCRQCHADKSNEMSGSTAGTVF